ncbi:MAG TPA: D-isomer specific 2-hydroxyacid dehydrogenase family protein [Streptosporangiaceae bacterium]
MSAPKIAMGPKSSRRVADAIRLGGGVPVTAADEADALVWLPGGGIEGLRGVLAQGPGIRWIQLPFAGVEYYAAAGLLADGRTWTCAKGLFAEPVAEHALALALAGLRLLPERIQATEWGAAAGTSLFDRPVTIVGGGGITAALIGLLRPFRARVTVVRRSVAPIPGAERVVGTQELQEVLPGALVVFLALALTPETTGIISAPELALLDHGAWLVNVARGAHVDTDALVDALKRGDIGGAALDVTDPEPLPTGHPLWDMPNCIITPHTANTWDMVFPSVLDRIATNVAHFAAGEPLDGLVSADAGY